jgi:hypothetical protein
MVKELGADVNQAERHGFTPLMMAAKYEYEDVVTFLIKYGANVKTSTHESGNGLTAAYVSRKYTASGEQTHSSRPGCTVQIQVAAEQVSRSARAA